jgi:hypothetical protein
MGHASWRRGKASYLRSCRHRDIDVPRSQRQSRRGADVERRVDQAGMVKTLPCDLRDLEQSWEYFRRRDLHNLTSLSAR